MCGVFFYVDNLGYVSNCDVEYCYFPSLDLSYVSYVDEHNSVETNQIVFGETKGCSYRVTYVCQGIHQEVWKDHEQIPASEPCYNPFNDANCVFESGILYKGDIGQYMASDDCSGGPLIASDRIEKSYALPDVNSFPYPNKYGLLLDFPNQLCNEKKVTFIAHHNFENVPMKLTSENGNSKIVMLDHIKEGVNTIPVSSKYKQASIIFGDTTMTKTLYACIEMEQYFENNLILYPNPVRNNLHINWGIVFDRAIIMLYDLNGKMVKETVAYKSMQVSIPIENLENGMYIAVIKFDNHYTLNRKFVKIN